MNIEALKSFQFERVTQTYTAADTMLYALSVGFGSSPTDPAELRYVYETALRAVPSQCVVLGYPGPWARRPEFGINFIKLLHGAQSFEFVRPLPAAGRVYADHEIEAVDDKGEAKGAVVHLLKRLYDANDDGLLATVRSAVFLRGDGGCGSFGTRRPEPGDMPEREPDRILTLPTLPQQALIYRLGGGDYNPIHVDPQAAAAAGFDRPILHGLCTMGITARGILSAYAPDNPDCLKSMHVRFSRPVYPGESIEIQFFENGNAVHFRCRVPERDVTVLDRGLAVVEH